MYQQQYGAPGYHGGSGPPAPQNGYGYAGGAGYQHQQQYAHAHAGPSSYAGAPAYGGAYSSESRSYPPPQQQQQHHYPQAPPPVQQAQLSPAPYNLENDPNVFRGYFSHELRSLTFNSKPIINGLTILAGDHAARMAPVVAQCLEDHIRQAHPSIKLPSLYLLDSICKNIGHPYPQLFSNTIDRILLTAYYEVDPATKAKVEELVGTWRNGGPDRRELFQLPHNAPPGARPPQQVIEERIWGRPPPAPVVVPAPMSYAPSAPPIVQHQPQSFSPPLQQPQFQPVRPSPAPIPAVFPPQSPVQPVPRPPTPPHASPNATQAAEKAAVLFELRKMLSARREQSILRPSDKNNSDQIVTLMALEQLVLNTPLQAAQIAQIRDQLAKLAPVRSATPPVIPKLEASDDGSDRGAKRQRLMSPSQGLRAATPLSDHGNPQLASLTSLLNPNIIRTASAQGMHPTGTPPTAFASLASSQVPTPVPSNASLPTSTNPTDPALVSALANLDPKLLATFNSAAQATQDAQMTAANKEANARALAAYEHHRLHFRVLLQNSDISRYRPGSSALIHEALPLGCKQCGNRYLDSPQGKDRLAKDLDRHLRISRRYNEGIGAQRAVGRSWFVIEEEWVLPSAAAKPSEAEVKTEQAKQMAASKAQLLNQFVRVPEAAATDEELARCPICKEMFKNEYSEEEEDWVWRNAVEIDGKFYHASCKAEQAGV